MILQGTAGPVLTTDGVSIATGMRQGRLGDAIVSELHGRFYEQVFRGNVYSIGCSGTALSATTITLTATSTPILGVWNPATSPVNLVLLQGGLEMFANTLTAPLYPGAFVWASSLGNAAITTGSAPFNRKTLANAGSQAKGFPGGVALTGLTTTPLVIFEGMDNLAPGAAVSAGTITAQTTTSNATIGLSGVQNFDGSL